MSDVPPRRRVAAIVGLVLALVVPALVTTFPIIQIPDEDSSTRAVLLNEAGMWTLTLALLAIVAFWERRPLASIGLVPPTRRAVLFGAWVVLALAALAMVAAFAVVLGGLSGTSETHEDLVKTLPPWLQLIVVLTAGFSEEILFRGYAIERMTELTGNRWIGAGLPILVFGGAHASFWGIGHAIVAGMTGFWLTLLYLWRRNLWTNITAHALLDGLVFVAVDIATAQGLT